MTTLKEFVMSRACKIGLAVLLAVSMVPVAAFSTAPAFAEDTQAEQAASETSVDERVAYQADSDDEASADEADDADEAEATTAGIEGSAIEGESPAAQSEQPAGEPAEGAATDTSEETADETVEPAEEADEELNVSDLQLETLETTVEEPFSFWTPFRLLFGANDTFTVPLKSGNYANWIDRLDLSGATDRDGVNYAQRFYDLLMEGSDNDGTADVLIDNTSFSVGAALELKASSPASRATIGNIYKVKSTAAMLVAIVDDPDAKTAGEDYTATEQRIRKYINETYGAFDRDCPRSFWRDVSFGTMFVRDESLGQTMCFFAMKNSTFDLRAEGYRSAKDIKAGIAAIDAQVEAINDEFGKTDASDYERVKFYNQWLCENNQYNTEFATVSLDRNKLAEFQSQNPDVWSAMSALSSRRGATGPVCEGYSRAMQLLCQKAGIGCVVVDGMTGAGAHMWNYVRIGSGWYGLDITWNDGGDDNDPDKNIEQYFLVGSNTGFDSDSSHPVSNQFVANGTKFINGPVLSAASYDPRNVTFAGAITAADTFPYGDTIVLSYSSTTEGDVSYTLTDGEDIAVLAEAATLAESTVNGGSAVLRITGVGTITVKVTLTPASGTALTDTITITAVPRPLTVSGTVLSSKVYDGTLDATVMTNGHLEGTVTDDDASKLSVEPTSARYNSVNAGLSVAGTATYKLSGDADTLKLYTLEASGTDNAAIGTITKRPVTTYFALTSTRVLTSEELPVGTVRFEAASSNRGKLTDDDLTPATSDLTIQTTGLPTTMPTLAAGSSRTYDVTWTSANSNVLTAINSIPAAANYDVSLSTDAAQNTVKLTIVNLENTTVIDADSPSGGATYRVEARLDGINDATVTKLTEAGSGYTSTESIIAKLLESLRGQTTKELADDRIAVYDMTLFVQNEDGLWEEATTENFPSDGVRVTLEYPEGTSGPTHSFYAAHMFTSESLGGGTLHQPGEIEEPTVMNGVDGPNFVLTGFSPVTLAWEDVPRNTQTADGQGGGIISPVSQSNLQQAGASAVSQTGDSLPVLSITVVALACIVLLVALMVRRNRHKKGDDKR